jgi:hypothetical protein
MSNFAVSLRRTRSRRLTTRLSTRTLENILVAGLMPPQISSFVAFGMIFMIAATGRPANVCITIINEGLYR